MIAPVVPFLAEHLWRNLVAEACEGAPESVFLASLAGAARGGRGAARGDRGGSPGRRIGAPGARPGAGQASPATSSSGRLRDEVRCHARGRDPEELRIREVRFEEGAVARVRFRPNLPALGPRLGPKLPAIRAALDEGRYEVEGSDLLVEGERLSPAEYSLSASRSPRTGSWRPTVTSRVELDTTLDPRAGARGPRPRPDPQAQHDAQGAGPRVDGPNHRHPSGSRRRPARSIADWIKDEVLALEIETDGGTEPRIAKA